MKQPNTVFTQMGMAALIPGMQYMLEQMQRTLDTFRETVAALQNGERPTPTHDGRGAGNYWSRMTPEERKAEMRRRWEVGHSWAVKDAPEKVAKLHPRDPNHPDHAAWIEKMRKVNKRHWAKLTPAERKARTAKMTAGRKRAAA